MVFIKKAALIIRCGGIKVIGAIGHLHARVIQHDIHVKPKGIDPFKHAFRVCGV